MLAKSEQKITFEEFMKLDSETDQLLEYIDGTIYYQASPSIKHQRISHKLSFELENFFKGKDCEVFTAPIDVILKTENIKDSKKVIPDLVVICDKSGFNENNYTGVPTLIIEILGPSNQAHDLVTKLNLYQKFGINEYWIVNPKLSSVHIYTLDNTGMYEETGIFKGSEIAQSTIFDGLNVNLNNIFSKSNV
jgi:Uncharacterized protein conserved in cyanobacteria